MFSFVVIITKLHIPEISAENPYEKTGTVNRHEHRALCYSLPKTIPEKFGTKLHVRCARYRYRFSGIGFRYRFLVKVKVWILVIAPLT